MKIHLALVAILLLCSSAFTQHAAHAAPVAEKPIALLHSRGFVNHKVSTSDQEAQRYFDQGLSLYYAFNEVDAARSFVRATELDPNLAIAWWGVALAKSGLGNAKSGAVRDMKAANEAIRKALSLSSPANERSYIEALAKLLPGDAGAKQSDLYIAYRDAMAEVHKRQPDDPDAATLYAMSIGNTGPFWGKWRNDGTAIGGAQKMVEVLEAGLKKHPRHLGLTHIYIHAVEDSPTPERALAAANNIQSLKLDQPELGHIIHMPSHIYLRMGDYKTAAEANELTASTPMSGLTEDFKQWHYGHVYSFLIYSYSMQGNYEKVRNALERVFDLNFPNAPTEQRIYRGNDVMQLVRFRKWDEILKLPVDPVRPGAWHWARTLAYAAKKDIPAAEAERKALVEAVAVENEMMSKTMPPEQFAKISTMLQRMDIISYAKLDAAIAVAKGDRETAVELLKKAIVEEDQVDYNEPPLIQDPSRETLGGVLLQMGKFAEAEEVFHEDLKYTRNNGRSLFGLWKSLEAQKKAKEAAEAEKQFREAWKYADTELRIEDL
ncbi:MAG: hypothetical protein IPM21_00485 [Acidobacteria bacterium]|nr:hypothetical protein [Acidobacteriota bacterium]